MTARVPGAIACCNAASITVDAILSDGTSDLRSGLRVWLDMDEDFLGLAIGNTTNPGKDILESTAGGIDILFGGWEIGIVVAIIQA